MLSPPPKPPTGFVHTITGDALDTLRQMNDASIDCVVTSPPYFGLRDYGVDGQIGLEQTWESYVTKIVDVFSEVRRVLKPEGTCWLNLGDSYATGTTSDRKPTARSKHGYWENPAVNKRIDGRDLGLKRKDLMGIPWRVAFALQADGWYLRQDIIWHKPNPMPESVRDRCTKAHEYIFMLSKSEKYYYDNEAVAEPVAASTVERISQANLANQKGSDRVPGKTNGNTKAVVKKQDGHGRRHAGFNARYFGTPSQRLAEGAIARTGGLITGGTEKSTLGISAVGTRNRRSVWTITTKPFKEAHFATFPPDLVEPCIKAGCPPNGIVLDPFGGAGTTGVVAKALNRNAILIELNPAYVEIINRRLGTLT